MKKQAGTHSYHFATIALALTILGAGRAHARDLIEITTPYFTVISALNEKDTRDLIEEMRTFQAVMMTFTTIRDLRPQVPLRIYLVNSSDWEKYLRPAKNVAGYMSPRGFSFDGVLNAQHWASASNLLFHEYTHFVLRNADSTSYPSWYDEGVAEVLSTVKKINGKVHVGEPPVDRLVDLADVGGGRWVPVQQLLQMRPKITEQDERTHSEVLGFYAQSWALVHYTIFQHPDGAKVLGRYLALHNQGVAADTAVNQAFGMSIADLEATLKRYVQARRYKILTAEPEKLSLPPMGDLKVRQLTSDESVLEIGQLILRSATRDRVDYFDRILKSQPNNALALAAKANALEFAKKSEQADAAIARALELAPTEREVLLIAGDIQLIRGSRLQSGVTTDAAKQERMPYLKRTIEYYDRAMATPYAGRDELEVIATYARTALQINSNLDQPLAQVAQIRNRYPTEPRIAVIHAQLLTSLKRSAEARPAWEVVARYGQGPLREMAITALGAL